MISYQELFILVFLLIVTSGSDVTMIIRNSLIYLRRAGVLTAIGAPFGDVFHMIYILIGFKFVVNNDVWIISIIKYLGISYLFYIGIKGLISKRFYIDVSGGSVKKISDQEAFFNGLLNSVLNPTAILFYISLFSVVISIDSTPMDRIIRYVIMIFF